VSNLTRRQREIVIEMQQRPGTRFGVGFEPADKMRPKTARALECAGFILTWSAGEYEPDGPYIFASLTDAGKRLGRQ
jgi:hypothetical protein